MLELRQQYPLAGRLKLAGLARSTFYYQQDVLQMADNYAGPKHRVTRARHKRRYRVTTDSRHKLPVAPNVLNRNFTPAEPNQVFSSDITYIWTDEGWLYLAVTLDLFNRQVVGAGLSSRARWRTSQPTR